MVDRTLSFESVHDAARINDPRVRALRSRVTLVASDELLRQGGRQAILSLQTRNGRSLRKHVRHVRGTWGDPMPRSEVDAKARDLLLPVLGQARTEPLLASLWQLEQLDAQALDTLIQRASPVQAA